MPQIAYDDPRADDVRALLEEHLAFSQEASPPEDVHALDADGLVDPAVTFFTLRMDGQLLAMGALKRLTASHGEVKSMHTALAFRGHGHARTMLLHLLSAARAWGLSRVSLETGSMAQFAPARALYASVGFVECEPFGDYGLSPHSTFMTLELGAPSAAGLA